MALVTNIQHRELEKARDQEETHKAIYSVVEQNGQACFQISTYGTKARKNPDIVSQTMRFSPSAIRQLKKFLDKHF